MKKSILFIVVLLLTQGITSFAAVNHPSAWANNTVEAIKEYGIIEEKNFVDYQGNITREDLVGMLVNLVEHMTRQNIMLDKNIRFKDTQVTFIYKAATVGITNGNGNGLFLPKEDVTREELAVFVVNTLKALDVKMPRKERKLFNDDTAFSQWSKEAIYTVRANAIMNGVGNNAYNPSAYTTKEEALQVVFNILNMEAVKTMDRQNNEVGLLDHNYYYHENFDKSSSPQWTLSGDSKNMSTSNGKLEFFNGQFTQKLIMDKGVIEDTNNYGLEFNMKLKVLGNEGDSGRPVFIISPRSLSKDIENQYAVTYYIETIKMGAITANLFQCKWAIINTSAPTGTEPLVTGHYTLKENVDYLGRLSIETTVDQGVKLDFYIEGPSDPLNDHKPLLSYTDHSDYKITETRYGPTFGSIGYENRVWGVNPSVSYDNIKIYELNEFKNRSKLLEKNARRKLPKAFIKDNYKQVKYLVNNGFISYTTNAEFKQNKAVTLEEVVISLSNIDSGDTNAFQNYTDEMLKGEITRQTLANMIYEYEHKPTIINGYDHLVIDHGIGADKDSMNYVYQQGLMAVKNGRFNGSDLVYKETYAQVLSRLVNPSKRLKNSVVSTPDVIASHGVLQRDEPIPIWGSGMSGDEISVDFNRKTYTTKVVDGEWKIYLEEQAAGGPYSLRIKDSGTTLNYTNIYVGEVFLVAGQSNAEMSVAECDHGDELVKKYVKNDKIRFYYNEHLISTSPQPSADGFWYESEEWVINESSAIGTFFVDELVELNKDLEGVMIGIIRLTYGGSSVEVFLPNEAADRINAHKGHKDPLVSGYWNGFMDYLMPYNIKGVLYYQGENSSQLKHSYEPLLRAYINGLREKFEKETLPIIMVQIAGYGDNYYESDDDSWPVIREVQMRVANTTEHLELVSAIDLGDEDPLEIHPTRKREIGQRLAYTAIESFYDKEGKRESPELKSYVRNENEFVIDFKNVGTGLYFVDNGTDDFEIKTEDGNWVKANHYYFEAFNVIKVWAEGIDKPQGVRYAWRNYPSANYFNSYGYPLLPFNSTVDLKSIDFSHLQTDKNQIVYMNHLMKSGDGIINRTRDNQFRMIVFKEANIISHFYAIENQSKNDEIILLKRLDNAKALFGTNEEIITLYKHKLSEGDWIRNNTRGWVQRQVLEVIDKHHILVERIEGQSQHDVIERYKYREMINAE